MDQRESGERRRESGDVSSKVFKSQKNTLQLSPLFFSIVTRLQVGCHR